MEDVRRGCTTVLECWTSYQRCRWASRPGFFLAGQLSYMLLFQCVNVDAINTDTWCRQCGPLSFQFQIFCHCKSGKKSKSNPYIHLTAIKSLLWCHSPHIGSPTFNMDHLHYIATSKLVEPLQSKCLELDSLVEMRQCGIVQFRDTQLLSYLKPTFNYI